MTYSTRSLGCGCGMGEVPAVAPTSRALTEPERAALRAKLDDALARYRAKRGEVQRLMGAVPFTVPLYDQASSIARRSRTGTARMTTPQFSALLSGTMVKVESVLIRAQGVLATARTAAVGQIVNDAVLAADRATARFDQLVNSAQAVRNSLRGMGDDAASGAVDIARQVGTGFAALVAVLIGGSVLGPVGAVVVAGAIAYSLYESNTELSRVDVQITRYAEAAQSYCRDRNDRAQCLSEFNTIRQGAAADAATLAAANAAAEALARRERDPFAYYVLRPLGEATPYLVAGGGVLVAGATLYVLWPWMKRARSGAVTRNRRRRR